jgi:hypothetical protein
MQIRKKKVLYSLHLLNEDSANSFFLEKIIAKNHMYFNK